VIKPDLIWSLPLDLLALELIKLPSIVTSSRLELMGLSPDLTPGLQALVGDPLWLLARQWQFEELRGEDGGTPIGAVVVVEQARLSRLHPGAPGWWATRAALAQAVDPYRKGLFVKRMRGSHL
jgi:hypothetical protein